MALDSIFQSRIDRLVADLEIFFTYKVPIVKTQIKQDMQYIKVLCKFEYYNTHEYIGYYKSKIREIYYIKLISYKCFVALTGLNLNKKN